MQRALLRGVVFTVAITSPAWLVAQRAAGPSAAAAPPKPMTAEALSGAWDYNEQLSVDAATGRPERAPRSATQRTLPRDLGSPPPSGARPGGGSRTGLPGGAGTQDGLDEARRAMTAVLAAERRTLIRDLLEIPEQLTIRARTSDVTFIDDLERERTYSTDGTKQKYILSAAKFEASGAWSPTYFRKEIEGANNFRMSETYFLSEDGLRLFVIVRVGDPKKPETMAGVNRVYDRIITDALR